MKHAQEVVDEQKNEEHEQACKSAIEIKQVAEKDNRTKVRVRWNTAHWSALKCKRCSGRVQVRVKFGRRTEEFAAELTKPACERQLKSWKRCWRGTSLANK